MTRDDFPFSLQPYAMPDGGDATADVEGWSLVLLRAADEAERVWFRNHGFAMQGRVWVRKAPAVRKPDAPTDAPKDSLGGTDLDTDPAPANPTPADPTPADPTPADPTPGVAA
ncbi:hypothetical protein [Azospirillum rugosum]|uniref:Uncharacterized protein n=1 Tax=Azospirillum rugosum TaxID=416170 RepID=A0ABS4SQ33_9PROT|nr:hypothetical protein [Azospirillum rugosum]MBP2294567.1 hypothetical protein [Azospirillum rugosum]MDQ0524645.1 hypothetical protein [Azospirillum rugosum]